jgi:hypothetical protein
MSALVIQMGGGVQAAEPPPAGDDLLFGLDDDLLVDDGASSGEFSDALSSSWTCTVYGGEPPYRIRAGELGARGETVCSGAWLQQRTCVQIQRRSFGVYRTAADSCGTWSTNSFTRHEAKWACSGTHTVRSRVRSQLRDVNGTTHTSRWYTSAGVTWTC